MAETAGSLAAEAAATGAGSVSACMRCSSCSRERSCRAEGSRSLQAMSAAGHGHLYTCSCMCTGVFVHTSCKSRFHYSCGNLASWPRQLAEQNGADCASLQELAHAQMHASVCVCVYLQHTTYIRSNCHDFEDTWLHISSSLRGASVTGLIASLVLHQTPAACVCVCVLQLPLESKLLHVRSNQFIVHTCQSSAISCPM